MKACHEKEKSEKFFAGDLVTIPGRMNYNYRWEVDQAVHNHYRFVISLRIPKNKEFLLIDPLYRFLIGFLKLILK